MEAFITKRCGCEGIPWWLVCLWQGWLDEGSGTGCRQVVNFCNVHKYILHLVFHHNHYHIIKLLSRTQRHLVFGICSCTVKNHYPYYHTSETHTHINTHNGIYQMTPKSVQLGSAKTKATCLEGEKNDKIVQTTNLMEVQLPSSGGTWLMLLFCRSKVANAPKLCKPAGSMVDTWLSFMNKISSFFNLYAGGGISVNLKQKDVKSGTAKPVLKWEMSLRDKWISAGGVVAVALLIIVENFSSRALGQISHIMNE